MLKIGIADYYLDNWHANYYPDFLRQAAKKYGFDADIVSAFAFCDRPGGVSTDDWCAERSIRRASSMEEMLQEADAVMVIAADNSAWHPMVCEAPLASGKPVFVDKTFAPDVRTGREMFQRAEEHGTPVFSSSAQRYCQSILDYQASHKEKPRFMSTVGPHDLDNYAVHQLEPIVALMGRDVQRVKCFCAGDAVTVMLMDYGGGRMASFTQTPNPYAEFNFMVSDGTNGQRLDSSDFYINTMHAMLQFFETGIPPVPAEDTLAILALIEAAKRGRQQPDCWMEL